MTMECGECLDLLSAYLDGELSDAERAKADAHLAQCARCRRELAVRRATHRLIAEHAPPADPGAAYWDEFVRRVEERVRELPAPVASGAKASRLARLFASPTVRFAGGIAVAAAVLLVALRLTYRPSGSLPKAAAYKSAAEPEAPAPQKTDAARPETLAGAGVASMPIQEKAASRDTAGETLLASHEIALAAGVPPQRSGEAEEAKPARGGMAYLSQLHAERARMEEKRLLIPPEEATDPLTRSLREEELRLRGELARSTDTTRTNALNRDLADVLYRLATCTGDWRDVNRALLLWRPQYDRLAAAFGDSTVNARLARLERLLLERIADSTRVPVVPR